MEIEKPKYKRVLLKLSGEALAGEDRFDEGCAAGLRLRLQRLSLVFGHDAVLRKCARESADVAGGGVRGHGRRRAVQSRVGVSTRALRKQGPCRAGPAGGYSIRIKLNLTMMPARQVFVKAGQHGRPAGAA